MNAPRHRRSREEIIDDIIAELYPLTCAESDAKAALRNDIEILTKMTPLWKQISDRDGVKKSAKRLDLAFAELETTIQTSPGHLITRLFIGPVLRSHENDVSKIESHFRNRVDTFMRQLNEMRSICKAELERKNHPRTFDHEKNNCANLALIFMKKLSKHKATGSSSGRFFSITSCLYEALTGRQDANVKRACSAVIDFERKYPA